MKNSVGVSIGFTLICGGEAGRLEVARRAQQRALRHFPNLTLLSFSVGVTKVELWGREGLSDCTHVMPDGSHLVLVGSPTRSCSWAVVQERIEEFFRSGRLGLPWEGRFILILISADGSTWRMWNDWVGSISVYHSSFDRWRIASSLEPVVVSSGQYSAEDVFLPGLISLLIQGHFMSDWTLFKRMKMIPPDCCAQWDERGSSYRWLSTVQPSNERWEYGWNDLVDEMHELSCNAIKDSLSSQRDWILPLSGGLDSRLIAVVGTRIGVNMKAFTWGLTGSHDVLYARQIARALGLSWRRIDLGTKYLSTFAPLWGDLFGSAMHFHGMYQIPFLEALKHEAPGRVVSGFIGDILSGAANHFVPFHASNRRYHVFPEGYIHWRPEEIVELVKVPVEAALERIAHEVSRSSRLVPGSLFQRLGFLYLWSRQRFFINFQATMSDYWRGVATPYLNRAYARFCFSLPRTAIDNRRLLEDVISRYYPTVAKIPRTFTFKPITYTGSYLLRRRIAKYLPSDFLCGTLREFKSPSQIPHVDSSCVRSSGRSSFWPIDEALEVLGSWFDLHKIEEAYGKAQLGDMKAVRKLQSIQAFAFRLMEPRKEGNP